MKQRDLVSALSAVAVCGLVLSGAMSPHLQSLVAVTADHRAQERTAADIDNIGRAMLGWLTDQVGAAAAGQSQMPDSAVVSLIHYEAITHEALESVLVPSYLRDLPELDGWNWPYELYLNTANPLALRVMAIRSPGRDGSDTGDTYPVGTFEAESFDEDLVWTDGYRVRWPRLHYTDHQAQRETVKDIDRVGKAMLSWLTDQAGFAADGKVDSSEAQDALAVDLVHYPEISRDELASFLVPQYIQYLPEADGWYWPYDYRLNVDNPLANQVMAIRSAGRDGAFSGDSYLVTEIPPGSFDEDIVWADGSFAHGPGPAPEPVHPPYSTSFYTLPPCRVVDTRQDSALLSGYSVRFELAGKCGIPDSARAVAVNATVANPTGLGYLTLYPGDMSSPQTSTINFQAGTTRANQVVLELSITGDGGIGARPFVAGNGQLHLILDVSGYFE